MGPQSEKEESGGSWRTSRKVRSAVGISQRRAGDSLSPARKSLKVDYLMVPPGSQRKNKWFEGLVVAGTTNLRRSGSPSFDLACSFIDSKRARLGDIHVAIQARGRHPARHNASHIPCCPLLCMLIWHNLLWQRNTPPLAFFQLPARTTHKQCHCIQWTWIPPLMSSSSETTEYN